MANKCCGVPPRPSVPQNFILHKFANHLGGKSSPPEHLSQASHNIASCSSMAEDPVSHDAGERAERSC
ncbi:unnamed protein product [Diplocarpon coronariae]